ncbi:DNA-3-methyladenine glycosylase [Niveibacterium umoris]|uniref:DNA-3-methyladenine glycosylase II n=1 Tax=Niveibacterium umoris TaxID=1193620 RepID=A0A840BQD7_9RHOO|nr:DNA-3-methyladenine glycosylase 2 family protein [Niveibacterium umoris]MBB4013046.1 DNA-3-methyladenine glycosylase II [Niveibacterium umoris]
MSAIPTATVRRLRAAERGLAAADPALGLLIARHGHCGIVPQPDRSPYAALVTAVMYQQLAGKAAETIHRRFLALFPGHDFPSPAQLLAASDEHLRSAGLSRQKQGYLRDIAAKAHEGLIPVASGELDHLDDEAIIARLTAARGVGRWTVEMFLIFTLGRLDVLPVDDYGVRAGYARAHGLDAMPTSRELREIGAAWAPWRSVASWYLWQAADAD